MMDALQWEDIQWEIIRSHLKIVANTGETLYSQQSHLEEEDEDEDDEHAMNDGENLDDVDQYEERIERGDFENDIDEHEVVPNFEEENMEYHDEGDEMMILASSMIQIRPLGTVLLRSHSTQILGKIWLILHVFRYHFFVLGKMGCIFIKG